MAMTNETMAPVVPANNKPTSAATLREAIAALPPKEVDPLEEAKQEFADQLAQDEANAVKMLSQQEKLQHDAGGVALRDLTEDDAYNLEVAISAKNMSSPGFLKIELKDKNYVPRWANRHAVRISGLIAQGFRYIKKEEVSNLDSLEMFLDVQGNFVYADLVAVKTLKNVYYAGLRKAYTTSLRATNNKKAAQDGAVHAKNQLERELTGAERSYIASHDLTEKPIYNPNLGV